jgi:hypothetical protein
VARIVHESSAWTPEAISFSAASPGAGSAADGPRTIHSAGGFITFESDSADDALNQATMASFLFASLPAVN